MKSKSTIPGFKGILGTVLLAASLSLATGCGTLMRGSAKNGEFYDMKVAAYPATKIDGMLTGMGAYFLIVDLPFSLVTDTLLLPYDLATREDGKTTSAQDSKKP